MREAYPEFGGFLEKFLMKCTGWSLSSLE